MFAIAVVGAGVVGLPAALQIQKDFGPRAKVTVFAEKFSPSTTGDVAAGLWRPYALGSTPQDRINKWAKCTHDYILRLWKEGRAEEMGISLQPVVELLEKNDSELPQWLELTLGYSKLRKSEVEKFNREYGENFTEGYAFVSFSWEASKFLPYFKEKFLENGGVICQRTIQNLEELSDFDVIVNCAGLGSKSLVPDPSMYPIRGQVIRVHAPWQYHTLFFNTEKEHIVILNQDCVILGLTHQVGNYQTSVDENDKKHISDGCFKYVPALSKAPVLNHQVGLRPGRDTLRLEVEHRKVGDKMLKIVHNYGHGGSGITLTIGCAEETAQLVKKVLTVGGINKL